MSHTRLRIRLLCLGLIVLGLHACAGPSPKKPSAPEEEPRRFVESSIEASTEEPAREPVAETPGIQEEPQAAPELPPALGELIFMEEMTLLQYSEADNMFETTFHFANPSRAEVVIEQVRISCGCMTPRVEIFSDEFPDEPIWEGAAAPPFGIPAGTYGQIHLKVDQLTFDPGEKFYLTLVAPIGWFSLIGAAPGGPEEEILSRP